MNKVVSGPIAGARHGGFSIIAKAGATLVKGVPYHFLFDGYGYKTQAISAAAGMVGVAKEAYASGDYGEFIVEGTCEVLLTAAATAVGDGLIPDVSDVKFKTSGSAMAGIIGQAALTHMGVALEASAAGGELIDAYVNGLNVTCVA